ncbi:MAG: DUF561 domain-containing protein [Candidatus Caenarcaniphilales bacterium]|nr:DUF561 domain-containing protein [Candidatus Caenarcaniphilales bacterium]
MPRNKVDQVRELLSQKSLLKIIAGIFNFDKEQVLRIAEMTDKAGDLALDICAREDIVSEVRTQFPNLIIAVSAIKVSELNRAQELGADILELGNFEALYEQGIFYSAEEVYSMAAELINIKNENTLVSITVPGHLQINDQIDLAKRLETLGVDIIQTEGAALSDANATSALGSIQKVALTLSNTIELDKVLESTAIMTASGISPDTIALAISAGARAVGVGSFVNKHETKEEIYEAITKLKAAISLTQIEKTLEEQELIYS